MAEYTLSKAERLNSKAMIERLFAGGNKSFPAFPLRVVYMWLDASEGEAPVSILTPKTGTQISLLPVFSISY